MFCSTKFVPQTTEPRQVYGAAAKCNCVRHCCLMLSVQGDSYKVFNFRMCSPKVVFRPKASLVSSALVLMVVLICRTMSANNTLHWGSSLNCIIAELDTCLQTEQPDLQHHQTVCMTTLVTHERCILHASDKISAKVFLLWYWAIAFVFDRLKLKPTARDYPPGKS